MKRTNMHICSVTNICGTEKTNSSASRTNSWPFASEVGINSSNEKSELVAAGFLNW